MVFPCPSPCAERAEKARSLATPCRVTFERRTPRRFFIKLRNHDGPAEKPAKAQKLVCSRFKDFFYIGCMVILYGGNSCSGQPYVLYDTVLCAVWLSLVALYHTVYPSKTLKDPPAKVAPLRNEKGVKMQWFPVFSLYIDSVCITEL